MFYKWKLNKTMSQPPGVPPPYVPSTPASSSNVSPQSTPVAAPSTVSTTATDPSLGPSTAVVTPTATPGPAAPTTPGTSPGTQSELHRNTVIAYKYKQDEFQRWCAEKGFLPLASQLNVTEDKLHQFLAERVIDRPVRRPVRYNPTTGGPVHVGRATIMAYVSAAVDLWKHQGFLGINNHPNPNGPKVKQLLKTFDEKEKRRSVALSPAVGSGSSPAPGMPQTPTKMVKNASPNGGTSSPMDLTLSPATTSTTLSGQVPVTPVNKVFRAPPSFTPGTPTSTGSNLSPSSHITAAAKVIANARRIPSVPTAKGTSSPQSQSRSGSVADTFTTIEQLSSIFQSYWQRDRAFLSHLRDCTMFGFSHYGVLRGESSRNLKFQHMFEVELDREGPSKCHAIVLLLNQGAKNTAGRVCASAIMRAFDVRACSHSAIAFYLFWRSHFDGEEFPAVSTEQGWFDSPVFKGDAASISGMDFSAHLKGVTKGLSAISREHQAIIHAGRETGARMAELDEKFEADLRRDGLWESGPEGVYSTASLPREVMRAAAGFPPERGGFLVKRASLEPPPSLLQRVFPQIEAREIYWQQFLKVTPVAKEALYAIGFLRLLRYLRIVILQDAVLLRAMHPAHPIFSHPIFTSEEFLAYADQLKNAMEAMPPNQMQMSVEATSLINAIEKMHADLKLAISEQTKELQASIAEIKTSLSSLQAQLDSITAASAAPSSTPTQQRT